MNTTHILALPTSALRKVLSCAALVATAALAGCAPPDEGLVHGRVDVISQSGSALSEGDVASMSLKGTYGATCDGRASDGTDPWTSADLAVRKKDADCVLTITALVIDGVDYTASSNLALDTADTFAAAALAYSSEGAQGTELYANAKIDSLAFEQDFTITLLASADTSSSSVEKGAEFATQSESLEAETVPAPSYELGFADLRITKDVDGVVPAGGVTGYVTLLAGGAADGFAVVEGAVSASSFAAVDDAFGNGSALPEDGQVPASYFAGLEGDDLDENPVWTVIFRNSAANGVRSYQLIHITFTP